MNPLPTIYIDRDGVINKKLHQDYVKNISEFQFLEGVLEGLSLLKKQGFRLVLLTNQQGIGKGLMSESDLNKIHHAMLGKIEKAGGGLDAIYFCPHLESDQCLCRKPKPGMVLESLKKFPDIDLKKSYFIGDSHSDILLAKEVSLNSILIHEKNEFDADYCFSTLLEASEFLIEKHFK